MGEAQITDGEFQRYRRFLHEVAGIQLSEAKKPLVCSRLARRLRARSVASYGAYLDLIQSRSESAEWQTAVDLLTTNETYFFREAKHFDLLARLATASGRARPFRVWSAACSSGEEPYSIAMVLADTLGEGAWEVFASDLSARMLERARIGHYPMARAEHMPPAYLRRFCLKGIEDQDGTLLVDPALRERVTFAQINLVENLPDVGLFDVVLLRNVLIYFNADTKREVVRRLAAVLRPEGHLFIGHSETLHGLVDELEPVVPTVYRRQR